MKICFAIADLYSLLQLRQLTKHNEFKSKTIKTPKMQTLIFLPILIYVALVVILYFIFIMGKYFYTTGT